jgi:gliding motility-associated-like protein
LPVNIIYTYILSANGTKGCANPQNITVTVNPSPVLNNIPSNDSICGGSIYSFGPASSTPSSNYNWTRAFVPGIVQSGTIGTDSINETLTNTTTLAINVTYVYTSTANACTGPSENIIVKVNPSPILSNAGSQPTICSADTFAFTASSLLPGASYNWVRDTIVGITQPGTTGAGAIVNESLTNTSFSAIDVTYAFIATGCNTAPENVIVTVNPFVIVDAGADVEIEFNDGTTIGGNPTGPGGATYVWTTSTNLDDATSANPFATPINTEQFNVFVDMVLNSKTCSGTDSVIVTVLPPIYPNDGLTPNGDGINDVWNIDFLENYPECIVEIYNRWGELVFKSPPGYTIKWDGTFRRNPLPIGTYYYIIDLNDPNFPKKYTGPVTIMR